MANASKGEAEEGGVSEEDAAGEPEKCGVLEAARAMGAPAALVTAAAVRCADIELEPAVVAAPAPPMHKR